MTKLISVMVFLVLDIHTQRSYLILFFKPLVTVLVSVMSACHPNRAIHQNVGLL